MKRFLLQHLLEASAQRYPERVAVACDDEHLTFQGLEEKSGRLANLLFEAGLAVEEPVAIYLNKSIEAIVAFLAVLKAGGFYVPLDSTYSPVSRIFEVIALSDTRYVITTTALWEGITRSDLPLRSHLRRGLTVVFLDTLLRPAGAGDDGVRPSAPGYTSFVYDDSVDVSLTKVPNITDRSLAYVLYTSGSTGVPKGVMITHLNALTFVNWATQYFRPQCTDVFANQAPLHFDLSVFDLYVSMDNGARVELVPFHISSNPRALVNWIEEKHVSFWYSVPQVWITILNYAHIPADGLRSLRSILFAGDVFPSEYLRQLMLRLPEPAYYNLYGPTETNVCTCFHVRDVRQVTDAPVPIGQACENTEVIALDEGGQPVGVGARGELFVRGSTVTAGYYRDPERTAEVFQKSPLARHNGALLYRTGDIVYRIDESNFSYVGRKDLMVKCAGFRIEIPEVERAFYSHADIAEAVVVSALDKNNTHRRLVAFVEAKGDGPLSVIAIKKHLAHILPRYMIPDTITQVPAIPKNANGKTDRARLAKWVLEC